MRFWKHYFRVAAAVMAGSIAWEFAGAVGMPALQFGSPHSQLGQAVIAAMCVLFLAYSNAIAKEDALK